MVLILIYEEKFVGSGEAHEIASPSQAFGFGIPSGFFACSPIPHQIVQMTSTLFPLEESLQEDLAALPCPRHCQPAIGESEQGSDDLGIKRGIVLSIGF